MKKIVLFAASMMLCAGIAFAQNPKKTNKNEKAQKEVTTNQQKKGGELKETKNTKNEKADKTLTTNQQKNGAQTLQEDKNAKHQCGKCPNAQKCEGKGTPAAQEKKK